MTQPKTDWGLGLLDKITILRGVYEGYNSTPWGRVCEYAQKGGYVAFSIYVRLPSFDLTTSARCFFR